jgi:serine/threonine-protein kinase
VRPAGKGKLSVSASGGWCNVSIDGVSRGPTPIAGLELSAGPHTVVCTPEGAGPKSASVNVAADALTKHKFQL